MKFYGSLNSINDAHPVAIWLPESYDPSGLLAGARKNTNASPFYKEAWFRTSVLLGLAVGLLLPPAKARAK